jgi:predicted phage terminase large subunit-like protein
MDPMKWVGIPDFECVIFRRSAPQITQAGGLWPTSKKLYHAAPGDPREGFLDWTFPSGARVKFAHFEPNRYEDDWQGAQIAMIGFDQLEAFGWDEFFFMFARNRSTCGIRPYIRATCNPDPDHWLRNFMAWWIDNETGLPIQERAGVVRWFVAHDEKNIDWTDAPQELIDKLGPDTKPTSFTFIPSLVTDNEILLKNDPGYLGRLEAMPWLYRQRLRWGNWNARATAGSFFKREWFELVAAAPANAKTVRYWDRAASAPDPKNKKQSYTAGVRMSRDPRGIYYVEDVVRFQGTAGVVQVTIKNTATQDGERVRTIFEKDPGQAGKVEAQLQVANLAGYLTGLNTVRESKGMRAAPFSAQCEGGNVKIVRGSWNDKYLHELENFDGSDKCMADQVDASSGAFVMLTAGKKEAGTWGTK